MQEPVVNDFDNISYDTHESVLLSLQFNLAKKKCQKEARSDKFNHIIKTQWKSIEKFEKEKQKLIIEKQKLENTENEEHQHTLQGVQVFKTFQALQNDILKIMEKNGNLDLAITDAERKLVQLKQKAPEVEACKDMSRKLKQKVNIMSERLKNILPTLKDICNKKSSLENQILALLCSQNAILETQKKFKNLLVEAQEDISKIKTINEALCKTGNEIKISELHKDVIYITPKLRQNIDQQLENRDNLVRYVEDLKELMQCFQIFPKSFEEVCHKRQIFDKHDMNLKQKNSSCELIISKFCSEAGTKSIKKACESFGKIANENLLFFKNIIELQRRVQSFENEILSYNLELDVIPILLEDESQIYRSEIEELEDKTKCVTKTCVDLENFSDKIGKDIEYVKSIVHKLVLLRQHYLHNDGDTFNPLMTDDNILYYIYILKIRIADLFSSDE